MEELLAVMNDEETVKATTQCPEWRLHSYENLATDHLAMSLLSWGIQHGHKFVLGVWVVGGKPPVAHKYLVPSLFDSNPERKVVYVHNNNEEKLGIDKNGKEVIHAYGHWSGLRPDLPKNATPIVSDVQKKTNFYESIAVKSEVPKLPSSAINKTQMTPGKSASILDLGTRQPTRSQRHRCPTRATDMSRLLEH
ncbi:hypothetical protein NA57DRAFT_77850 [Rhizodiscina lignyota]|uniref:Uncharacterized protein n=1 Tax=Rhizodiscina lignyota TaxID=1504668 RepID=A0A9P4IE18_9PEZI|nr:hypothetical protein NA57DRAFT_77850 [Rhizodiscina lignyota]